MFSTDTRSAGVAIPEGQNLTRSDLPSLTITSMVRIDFLAMQYVDDGGRVRSGLVCRAGDAFYLAPNGDQWLGQMRPLSERMAANTKAMFMRLYGESGPGEVPSGDDVDIIATEVAKTKAADDSPAP